MSEKKKLKFQLKRVQALKWLALGLVFILGSAKIWVISQEPTVEDFAAGRFLAKNSDPPLDTAEDLPTVERFLHPDRSFKCSKKNGCEGLFPVRSAEESQIGLLVKGEAALAARFQTLDQAKKSVRIQALIFKADESGTAIAERLIQLRRQGLEVKVIIDAFSNPDLYSQTLFFRMRTEGIHMEGYEFGASEFFQEFSFRDIGQVDKRFHDKVWLIDGEDPENSVAIVGGMNIANEYFRLGSTAPFVWRDQDFVVKGKIVQDMMMAFDRNFQDQKHRKEKLPVNTDKTWSWWVRTFPNLMKRLSFLFVQAPDPEVTSRVEKAAEDAKIFQIDMKPAKARFVQGRPRYKETYIRQFYKDLFDIAKEELIIVNAYFIPRDSLRESMMAAARRGAHVKIITNSPETNDLPQMAVASRYLYKELLSVNHEPHTQGRLEIFEWIGHKHKEGTNHAKFAIADKKYVIGGSYNLDARSDLLNSETVLGFENEELAQELTRQVNQIDMEKCEKISNERAELYHNPKRVPEIFKLKIMNLLSEEL